MADHARSDGDGEKAVVDLSNDDAWQARLEEARARREVALREKAKDPQKPKPKPWEAEAETKPIEPVIQAPTDDRVDFADRLDAIKKTKDEADGDAPALVDDLPGAFDGIEDELDEVFAREPETPELVAPAPTKRNKIAPSLVSEDAPDVVELAARYATPSRPVLDDVVIARNDFTAGLATSAIAIQPRPSRRPFGLAVALVAFAFLPLSVTVPPLEKGPVVVAAPIFVFEPALGLTTAMLWRPGTSQSNEWSRPAPLSTLPAMAPFGASVQAITQIDALQLAALDDALVLNLPGSDPQTLVRTAPPALVLDRNVIPLSSFLPSTRPLPRPGAPEVETRAPARPAILPENEPSPRVSPTSRTGASVLEVGRPELVSLEPTIATVPTTVPSTTVPSITVPQRVLRFTILVPGAHNDTVSLYEQDVQARGHTLSSVKEVPLNISTSNLRFFHDEDRAEAQRLGALYGVETRDFTWFRPKPSEGTVELWLEGRADAPQQRVERFIPPQELPSSLEILGRAPGIIDRIISGVLGQ